jgi:cytochrome c peroxidase
MNSKLAYIVVCMFALFSCKKDVVVVTTEYQLLEVPEGFPPVPWPADNAFTPERWALGKKLFYDPILSIDGSTSCASCHHPALAFADTLPTSPGAFSRPGTRNAPSLANVAYQPYYLREGSVPTLEMQVLVPIQEENEFAHNIVDIAEVLKTLPEYVTLSQAAYGREPDAYVITRAIATFERTLISGNSAFDQFRNGDTTALSKAAKRGAYLFYGGNLPCSSCHGDFNFTNYEFENIGLYETYADIGRERFTHNPADNAKFKVPSLRNVAVTAPYMHDGSLKTLREVLNHYNTGGKNHPNKSAFIKPLNLTEQDLNDLEAFLHSLTDYTFLANPALAK